MRKLHGHIYQLAEGGWKFGGTILNDTQISEFDCVDRYDTEEEAGKAMLEYCKINNYELAKK